MATTDKTCDILEHAERHVREHWAKGQMISVKDDDGYELEGITSDIARTARVYKNYKSDIREPYTYECCVLGALALGCVDVGMEDTELIAASVSTIAHMMEEFMPEHPEHDEEGVIYDGVMDFNDYAMTSQDEVIKLVTDTRAKHCK